MNRKNCIGRIVLWNKELEDFQPILSMTNMRNYGAKCINPEQLDLNGMNVRLSYFPLTRVVVTQTDETRIFGLFGETWKFIGDYLNFTTSLRNVMDYGLNPISSDNVLSTFSTWIALNMTDVTIPITSSTKKSRRVLDTVSLTSTWLHIPPAFKSDDTWMFRMITYDILLILLAIMIALSFMSIFVDKYRAQCGKGQNHPLTLSDHFFYTFATFVYQDNSLLKNLENLSRILTMTRRILSFLFWLISTANLFCLMSKKQIDAPFWDIPSFLAKSNMKLIIRTSSPGWTRALKDVSPTLIRKRIKFVDKVNDMYEIAGHHDNMALWQSEYIHRSVGSKFDSQFVPIGTCTSQKGFIIFGISKTFHYERAIITGILKIRESGLLDIIKQHWLDPPISLEPEQYQNVSLREVKTIFFLYQIGVVMSVVILIVEKIVIIHQRKHLRLNWNQQLESISQRFEI